MFSPLGSIMFSPLMILWVIFAHWVADFVCQTHWMASNKSKDWYALACHVLVYSAFMVLLLAWVPLPEDGFAIFAAVTFAAHFITDAITSRITSKLFMDQFEKIWHDGTVLDWRWTMKSNFDPHWFFVVIGFDQFLHYAQLFLTLAWVMSWAK